MAGGKLPPRQKMIGMMYLVLTALLAMNVSKDILDAFIIVNDGLEKTAANFKDKIDAQQTAFEKAFQENQAKVKPYYDKAKDVEQKANDLYDYITMIKANVIFHTEKLESIEMAIAKDQNGHDTTINLANIASKDNYDIPTNELIGSEPFAPKEGEYTARELRTKMEGFRDALLQNVEPGTELERSLNATFNFDDRKDASGTNNNWESYNFYHTPLAATLTILSKLQTDVRNAESDLIKQLYANVDAGSFKFNKLEAAVIAPSNYIIQGDSFRASVFLAAYDSTKNPQMLAGKEIDSTTWAVSGDEFTMNVENGKGQLILGAGAEGEFTWKGVINYEAPGGKILHFPFATTYTVAKPSLVVSADAMNVFYKGVDNPVSISVPGVPTDKLKPSITNGSLTSSGKGGYIVRVKTGNESVIRVSAEMPDGSSKSMGEMKFRVKTIPNPVPYVAGQTGSAALSKAALKAAGSVRAKMENFDFELTPVVTGYTIVTNVAGGGLVEEPMRGDKISGKAAELIDKLKRNQKVYFENIKVRMPDGTERTLPPIILKAT